MAKWTTDDIPDQSERTFVITGANSGIGLEAARGLAGAGARVVLACRDLDKAARAEDSIRGDHPGATLESLALDLADLASVRAFAKTLGDRHAALNGLVNNAGVMAIPRRETADGFEMQLGTNHLGHFALTGLLLERLVVTPGSRVVNVASSAHRIGRINFDDLMGEKSYWRWAAYGQAKLANLLFHFELDRRLAAAGHPTAAVACHPGYAATNLQTVGAQMDESSFMEGIFRLGNQILAQDAAMGALPTLYAATSPDAKSGDYIGPDGFAEAWGHPTKVGCSSAARDRDDALRLWQISEELTGVRFDLPSGG